MRHFAVLLSNALEYFDDTCQTVTFNLSFTETEGLFRFIRSEENNLN